MGLMNWLGMGKDIAEPIRAVGDLYTTDKARIEAQEKLEATQQKPQLAQLENNRLLVISGKFFNSGWLALLGWTCGLLILLYYAPQIIIITYVWGRQCIESGVATPFPMKSDEILYLVYLLFGVGGIGAIKNKF